MPLRDADSWAYVRFKDSLLESDHQAVYESGKVLPVWISRTPFHAEGRKGTMSKVLHFQLRPDPLAH